MSRLLRKTFAVFFAAVLFGTQGFAADISAALMRDAQRFGSPQKEIGENSQTPLDAQALETLENFNQKTDSSWQIRLNRQSGKPRSLVNGRGLKVGKSSSAALSFLRKYEDFLGVDRKQLKLKLQRKSPIGLHYYFDQYYKKLPVENAYVKVHTDLSGNLINYQSTYISGLDIDVKPAVSAEQAVSAAEQDANARASGAAELVIYKNPASDRAVLAWKLLVEETGANIGKWTYYVSAADGSIINRESRLMFATETFSANLYPVYPGFSGTSLQNVAIENMAVYYFASTSSGTAPSRTVTNSNGQINVSRAGRVFSTLSGPYFTVSNQRGYAANPQGYYVEAGSDGASAEPISLSWTAFEKSGNPFSTYEACADGGSYPSVAVPLMAADFHVGDMDNSGIIGADNTFLQFADPSVSAVALAKYIGQPETEFLGPYIANASSSQQLQTSFDPSSGTGTYTINQILKLCVPRAFTAGYSAVTSHNIMNTATVLPEVNVFYNLNETHKFFAALNVGNYINIDDHLPVIVNAYGRPYATSDGSGMRNAFYDVDAKVIMYGEGEKNQGLTTFRNFSLENAIVRHEYVHAVMANIWPIRYFDEGAAISEAVADYFALSSLANPLNDDKPYTSKIGEYVNLTTQSGEGAVRDLSGTEVFDAATWTENAINGQHKNSLFLSQTLWALRTKYTSGVYQHADELVWNALLFFPDSLLEFRDAMLAVAQAKASAWGADYSDDIEAAFDAHGLNYSSIITANGDIYEPNNGPSSAADIEVSSIASKQLNATLNPSNDVDYYSVSLAEGDFTAVLHLPASQQIEGSYYPLAMFLLDAQMQTVVDIVQPTHIPGQTNVLTADSTVTLNFSAPAHLDGNTGRYLLGVFKPDWGAYPSAGLRTEGAYQINFTFSKNSNIGLVDAGGVEIKTVDNFADGTLFNFKAPYNRIGNIDTASSLPSFLSEWAPNKIESLYSVRMLDGDMEVIPETLATPDAEALYLQIVPSSVAYDETNKLITGQLKIQGNFAALAYTSVFFQVFAKLRPNESEPVWSGYNQDYGIVSLGLSNLIKNKSTSGQEVYIRTSVFNPAVGSTVKIEITPKENGTMKAEIYTLQGILVKTLYDGQASKDVFEIVEWDGRNGEGNMVASGVYLLRVDGAGINRTIKKIVAVK